MSTREPLIAFVNSDEDVAAVKQFASANQMSDQKVIKGGIADACEYLKSNAPPNLLIVEIPSAAEAPALLDQLANVVDAHTKVIITGNVNEYSFFVWLTEIGITSYVLKPLKTDALQATYNKLIATPVAASDAKAKPPGKVVSFVGSKGGVGTSTTALLAAALAAQNSEANVALVDVNPQDGAISVLLDLVPSHGFHEALEKPDRIDELLVDRLSLRAGERFYIISAEESPGANLNIHHDAATALLEALKKKYDLIILDVSHLLNHFTKQCLRLSEQTVLVMDQTLLGLRGAMRAVEWIHEAKLPTPTLVLNKSGQYEKHEVGDADIEKSLKLKPLVTLNNAPQIFMEIDNSLKILKQSDHVVVKAINTLAMSLVPETYKKTGEEGADKSKKAKLSFLKKK